MTKKEELIKIILPEFLKYLKAQEILENSQKELDKQTNSSIHCVDDEDIAQKGDTSCN